MNILILSWRGPGHPNEGGAEQATMEHAKYWARHGHRVTLYTAGFNGALSRDSINSVDIIRSGKRLSELQIHVRAICWYLFGNHPKYDLVVDQFHGVPFLTPLYVKSKKLAYIHEVAKEVWKLNPWPRPLNLIPAYIGKLEPYIFQIFYTNITFMTVSDSTKKDLIKWNIKEQNIYVIKNGINKVKINRNAKKEMAITYLGAISKDKGIYDAMKVFSEIHRHNKSFKFWVIGKAKESFKFELLRLGKKYGLASRIKFWGHVSEPKKYELLSKSFILLNPSHREGWGLVNIEANYCGTPVVGYRVAGMVDSVVDKKTGLLCNFGDIKKLAESVIILNDNRKFYNRLRENAIEWAKEFSWQKSGRESLRLIENI